MSEYIDGWKDLTKLEWKKIRASSDLTWVIVTGGADIFQAAATLRANGIHPDKVPEVFEGSYGTLGEILRRVSETIPLTFISTPDS